MVDQTRTVSRNYYYNLRRRRLIRTSPSRQALRGVAHALLLSRLDYCNVLYAGAPDYPSIALRSSLILSPGVVSGCSHLRLPVIRHGTSSLAIRASQSIVVFRMRLKTYLIIVRNCVFYVKRSTNGILPPIALYILSSIIILLLLPKIKAFIMLFYFSYY